MLKLAIKIRLFSLRFNIYNIKLSYTGEPNNRDNQDCTKVLAGNQQLDDDHCDKDYRGICEIKVFDC